MASNIFQLVPRCIAAFAAAFAFAATAASAQTYGFATLQPGTLNHTTASAIAKVLKEKAGLNVLVQPTAGDNVIVPMVGRGEADVVEKTGWRLRIRKATANQSQTIQTINYNLKISSSERSKHLKQVGEEIFRPKLSEAAEVSLLTLGGFSQVGRSCMLLTTHESKILIDCGVNPGARNPQEAYPRFDWTNITLDELDAIVISHAHLDHTGFLPALFKYGYKGPVYCSEPTLPMMNLIQLDAIKVAAAFLCSTTVRCCHPSLNC